MGTFIENDTAVIRVFLIDGSSSNFIIKATHTANAVKMLIIKRLGLNTSEFKQFGLYTATPEKILEEVSEKPYDVHKRWGSESGQTKLFVFKRVNEVFPGLSGSNPPTSIPPEKDTKLQPPSLNNSLQMNTPNTVPATSMSSHSPIAYHGVGNNPLLEVYRLRESFVVRKTRELKNTEESEGARQELQKQIVIDWINAHLACRNVRIQNLTTDLQDGVALIKLLEVLSEKRLEKYHQNPQSMIQKIDNLTLWIRFLAFLGIKVRGVSGEDLYGMNENIILAIMLLVIRQYKDKVPKGGVDASSVQAMQQQLQVVEANSANSNLTPNNMTQFVVENGSRPHEDQLSVEFGQQQMVPRPNDERPNVVLAQQQSGPSPAVMTPSSPPSSPSLPPKQSTLKARPMKIPPKKSPFKLSNSSGPKSPPGGVSLKRSAPGPTRQNAVVKGGQAKKMLPSIPKTQASSGKANLSNPKKLPHPLPPKVAPQKGGVKKLSKSANSNVTYNNDDNLMMRTVKPSDWDFDGLGDPEKFDPVAFMQRVADEPPKDEKFDFKETVGGDELKQANAAPPVAELDLTFRLPDSETPQQPPPSSTSNIAPNNSNPGSSVAQVLRNPSKSVTQINTKEFEEMQDLLLMVAENLSKAASK
jgi:hypothetical protein